MRVFDIPICNDTNIFNISDAHIGTRSRAINMWLKMVNMVHSSYDGLPPGRNKVVDYGDFMEAIKPSDPRWEIYGTKHRYILEQKNIARRDYLEFGDHLIGVVEGNHPWELRNVIGYLTKDLCEEDLKRYKVKYLGWTGLLNYVFRNGNTLKHVYHHGFGTLNSAAVDPEQRKAALHIGLRKKCRNIEIDGCHIYAMGHTHKLLCAPPVVENVDAIRGDVVRMDEIITDPRWCINTGSFFRTRKIGFDSYGEIKGYKSTDIGFAILKIRDQKVAGVDLIKDYD